MKSYMRNDDGSPREVEVSTVKELIENEESSNKSCSNFIAISNGKVVIGGGGSGGFRTSIPIYHPMITFIGGGGGGTSGGCKDGMGSNGK